MCRSGCPLAGASPSAARTMARPTLSAAAGTAIEGQAVAALARLTALLAELGLKPKPAKTRIVKLEVGGEGVDFLGFHHRLVQSRARRGSNRFTYLARWPSRKAMQHARDRIRFMTMRARLAAPVEEVVGDINLFLRGWAGYFR
jgi:Group II intron, maturase-specific domain